VSEQALQLAVLTGALRYAVGEAYNLLTDPEAGAQDADRVTRILSAAIREWDAKLLASKG